jgi:hypothetical protein
MYQISLGCIKENPKVTVSTNFRLYSDLYNREGSLRCLMTGNNSKDSSVNAQRSDSAIGQVCFCF